jgi:uncharacterized protein (TIGR02453 family)
MTEQYYMSKTFNNFRVTSLTESAFRVAKRVSVDIVSGGSSFLCFVGPSSVGKTHLLCAIHREITLCASELSVLHISAADFVNTLCSALKDNCIDDFEDWVMSKKILILDNIEYVNDREYTQQKLFRIIERMIKFGNTVLVALCLQHNENILSNNIIRGFQRSEHDFKVIGMEITVFRGFNQDTIDFMWNIRFNNEKTWFEDHKNEYLRDFYNPMKLLAAQVFEHVAGEDNKRGFIFKVSRIYRDARRLHGNGLYKDCLWFSIERPSKQWTSSPAFWFELSPEGWSYGLGYYQAKPETMARFRSRIDNNPKVFAKLIAPLAKQLEFTLEGPDYVRKKEAPSVKVAPWYNKKSFSLIHSQINGEELFSPGLPERLIEGFRFLLPFYDYFSTLDTDMSPPNLFD